MRKSYFIFLTLLVILSVYLITSLLSYKRSKAIDSVSLTPKTVTDIDAQKNSQNTEILGTEVNLTDRKVYLGMWTQGFWDDNKKELHIEKLKNLENQINKKVAIAHYYRGWEFLDSKEFLGELQAIDQNGWRPMVSANPYFFDRCLVENANIYQAIAIGKCDTFLHSVGVNFKNFAKPVFFRFAWEMNIPSIEWGLTQTKTTPEDFISAWRHFHEIVEAEGATNVSWVFSPNTETSESIPYQNIYPGSEYVDWVGLDGYNWGTTQSWSGWQSFSTVFTKSYLRLTTIAPDKPLMLAEVNSSNIGGEKGRWYKDALLTQIPHNFPKINAIVIYNEDRSQKENVNWLIDISYESIEDFKYSLKNPLYVSTF